MDRKDFIKKGIFGTGSKQIVYAIATGIQSGQGFAKGRKYR